MADIKSPTLIWIKGSLFLLVGVLAAALLVVKAPDVTVVLLLGISVWAFCRFYYFAFYVIQHYVDSSFRFSGLVSFVLFAIGRRR